MKSAPPGDERGANESPPPSPEQLERLSAYEAGELDPTDAAAVRAWLAGSPEGQCALQRLQRLRQLTAALLPPALSPVRQRALGDRLGGLARAHRQRRRVMRVAVTFGVGALAAAAAVVVLVGRRSVGRESVVQGHGATHLRTGAGDFQLLPIGDRAVAFVGEETDVETHPGDSPAVRLLRGSVRLMVRRRPTEPFVVSTPAADVTVLGTEFDVTVAQGETDVSVVRGEVEVRNPQGKRRLWAREAAHARPGEAPRLWVPPRGVVSEGAPEVETRPAPP